MELSWAAISPPQCQQRQQLYLIRHLGFAYIDNKFILFFYHVTFFSFVLRTPALTFKTGDTGILKLVTIYLVQFMII